MKTFKIDTEFITITQFLKANDFITSGGEAKYFLKENDVLLNGVKCIERGKKIRNNDIVTVLKEKFIIHD